MLTCLTKATRRLSWRTVAKKVVDTLLESNIMFVHDNHDPLDRLRVLNCCQQYGGTECAYQACVTVELFISDIAVQRSAFIDQARASRLLTQSVADPYYGVTLYNDMKRNIAREQELAAGLLALLMVGDTVH